jgi:hypothetical protein
MAEQLKPGTIVRYGFCAGTIVRSTRLYGQDGYDIAPGRVTMGDGYGSTWAPASAVTEISDEEADRINRPWVYLRRKTTTVRPDGESL